MGKHQVAAARRMRDALRTSLGNRCRNCGETDLLAFDCIEPRGDAHHRMSWDTRMRFYRREHERGNLQLLCIVCNGTKGATHDKRKTGEARTDALVDELVEGATSLANDAPF